jgi:uncharacterized membrane protein YhaH (DUF805 family)
MDTVTTIRVIAGLLFLIVMVVAIVAYAKIFSKAGYSGWLCLVMLIPLVNVALLIWFGFTKWPIEKQLASLRQSDAKPPRGIGGIVVEE